MDKNSSNFYDEVSQTDTLVCLNSGVASEIFFLKFPIFRKIDVFRNPEIPDF